MSANFHFLKIHDEYNIVVMNIVAMNIKQGPG